MHLKVKAYIKRYVGNSKSLDRAQSTLTKVPGSFCTKFVPSQAQDFQCGLAGDTFMQVRHHCAVDITVVQYQVSQFMDPSKDSGCTWGEKQPNRVTSCNTLSCCITVQTYMLAAGMKHSQKITAMKNMI